LKYLPVRVVTKVPSTLEEFEVQSRKGIPYPVVFSFFGQLDDQSLAQTSPELPFSIRDFVVSSLERITSAFSSLTSHDLD
jgi:hypothetical protein